MCCGVFNPPYLYRVRVLLNLLYFIQVNKSLDKANPPLNPPHARRSFETLSRCVPFCLYRTTLDIANIIALGEGLYALLWWYFASGHVVTWWLTVLVVVSLQVQQAMHKIIHLSSRIQYYSIQ